MNQRDRILQMLERGPVCGTEFLRQYMPRYAARIHELRTEGYRIETVPCTNWVHDHRGANQIVYRLIRTGKLF